MQINSINNTNPNFGMAIKATPKAIERINQKITNAQDWFELNHLINREKTNDVVDVLFSTKDGKLFAQVGSSKIEEARFNNGIMRTIKEAADRAREILEKRNTVKLEADTNYITTICDKIERIK